MKRALFLWVLLFSALLATRWIFHARWERFDLRPGRLAEKTVDCAGSAPKESIEVAVENAQGILQKGFRQVLVSEGDGCYLLNAVLKLEAIARDRESGNVVERATSGRVLVSMIIDLDFRALPKGKQRFARGKFKDRAPGLRYQLVTLAKASAEGVRETPTTAGQTQESERAVSPDH